MCLRISERAPQILFSCRINNHIHSIERLDATPVTNQQSSSLTRKLYIIQAVLAAYTTIMRHLKKLKKHL